MKDNVKEFMNNMNSSSEKDYMFNLIAYGIAPTVCGFKASTLINLSCNYKNTYNLWREHGLEFSKMVPIKVFELNRTDKAYTILFYDEEILSRKLRAVSCQSFLRQYGYRENCSLEEYLYILKERYKNECPHEVGLFLDIPLEDVLGFIKNHGKNFLYCGYWKVYSSLDRALKTFESYDWSKKRVIDLIADGSSASEVIRELKAFKTM